MKKDLHYQQGFTLYELLIAMAVSTFILMAALSSLTDFVRIRGRAQFNNRMLSTSELVFSYITTDMHQSAEAEITGLGDITLKDANGVKVADYTINANKILRNGEAVTPDDIKVTNFDMISLSPSGELALIQFKLGLKTLDKRAVTSELERSTTISLRSNRGTAP